MHQHRPDSLAGLGEREFVALIAFLQALQALAIDAMLPALGVMASDLGAPDPNQRQLIVGAFLIGAGLGSLVPGALADRYGRRPVLLGSLTLYVTLTLACALVTDFTAMVALRAAIGFASAGMSVLPSAIIRDRYEGDKMARLQSMISMIFMLVPMIAPALGQAVLLFAGWRWIFGMMALLGVFVGIWAFVRLGETLHPEFRQPVAMKVIAANMVSSITNRESSGYVIGMALLLGAMFGYINSSQQLVAEHFGAGAAFPVIFGVMALAMSLSSFTNSRIVERWGARRVSQGALLVFLGCGLLQLYLATQTHQTLWTFIPVQTVNMCMMGFIGANFGSISLQPFARIAGAAASAQGFLRMLAASVLGSIVGSAYDGTARPIALAFVITAALALLLVLYSEHGRLFRRVYPRGVERPVPQPDVH